MPPLTYHTPAVKLSDVPVGVLTMVLDSLGATASAAGLRYGGNMPLPTL